MTTNGKLAAALIAGGRSTRMGRDKARLVGAGGQELWQSQLNLLRKLQPDELLISCREDQALPADGGVRLVFDQWQEAGPLGGIVSVLETMEPAQLLVLAVDLPAMTPQVLEALVEAAGNGGAVFRRAGHLEPLAAIYPKAMALSGRRRLEHREFALRGWIAEAGELMCIVDLPQAWEGAFLNVNDPDEWAKWVETK
jgi:molybdopterin-guanine dinucleotide biosynthesis protein A